MSKTADAIEAFIEAKAKYLAEHKADHQSQACFEAYEACGGLQEEAEEALTEMLEDEPLVLLRALRLAQDDTTNTGDAPCTP